jgi:hypothetical protein
MKSASSPFQRPPNTPPTNEEKKPSLLERLDQSGVRASVPPTPKPFDMSEPVQQPGGLWGFWLTADDDILRYVANLNCILNASAPPAFSRTLRGRRLFSINPRYDHEDAWLWIFALLEAEAKKVTLTDTWEDALKEAQRRKDETDG